MNAAIQNVVIVDDEDSVRRALKRLMVSAGYRCAAFASGAEFLDSLKTDVPACVVLDLHMPGMSGFDIQQRLRIEGKNIPVVAITGHDSSESQERAVRGGAVAYLRKPVDDRLLLQAVSTAIAGNVAA